MKYILLSLIIGCSIIVKATTYNVAVSSNMFTPNSLTINVGDDVIFTNTGGNHNVDATNPSNPETFLNGSASPALWTYTKLFTIAGAYNIVCTPHAPGMAMTITVNSILPSVNYTPGSLVVMRLGDGVATYPATGAVAGFLDEYNINTTTATSTLVNSNAIPVVDNGLNQSLTFSAGATSEGALSISPNGNFLAFAGYDAAVGTAAVNTAVGINRTVGIMGTNGVLNTQSGILSGTGYNGGSVRGALTLDGTQVWLSGAGTSGGVRYIPAGSVSGTSVSLTTSSTNTRSVKIIGGQLYFSSASGTFFGVSTLGSGTPTTSGQTASLLTGLTITGPQPYSFEAFDLSATEPGIDVIYVGDDRLTVSAPGVPGGGLQKWSKVAGVWTFNNNVFGASTTTIRHIVAKESCGKVQIYASSEGTIQYLLDESGHNTNMTATFAVVANAPANTKFRGISFAPGTVLTTVPLVATASSMPTSCGNTNGMAMGSASAGTTPYSYAWVGPAGATSSSASFMDAAAGLYTLIVTDNVGCTATATTTVASSTGPVVTVPSAVLLCNGNANGALTATVSGAVGPIIYSWSNGDNIATATNLAAGTYVCTVTNNGCTVTGTNVITQPAALIVITTSTNVGCNGASTGSIIASASGGTQGYSYNWSNGAPANVVSIANLPIGIYTVSVTDANGCISNVASQNISQPASALSASITAGGTPCTPQYCATISGGTSGYITTWTTGATTNCMTPTVAASISATIEDANGCTFTTAPINFTPIVNNPVITSVGGVFSVNVPGATAFQWVNCGTNLPIAGAVSSSYTPANPGVSVLCTTTVSGCENSSICFSTLALSEVENANISMAPNPTSGLVNIQIVNGSEINQIDILNAMGQIVKTIAGSNFANQEISLSEFANQIYIVRVKTNNGVGTTRILKM